MAPFATPSLKSECKHEDEMRKYLASKAMAGDSHVCFDNVTGPLGEGTLAATVTSTVYEDRIMGGHGLVKVPFGPVWIVTSNNAQLSADAASRAVVIRLDASLERPGEREFKKSPLQYIKNNRGQVAGAIITIIRNWIEKGCPEYNGPNRCRFMGWLKVMGGILQAAGINGILDNHKAITTALNPESEGWARLVLDWEAEYGDRPVQAKQLVKLAENIDFFALKLSDNYGQGAQAQRVGMWLNKNKDRVIEGFKLEKLPPDRNKISHYRIRRVSCSETHLPSESVNSLM
jgi:hypothetical protein